LFELGYAPNKRNIDWIMQYHVIYYARELAHQLEQHSTSKVRLEGKAFSTQYDVCI
jgi:hypothetical protein